jgi:hypothetical protein
VAAAVAALPPDFGSRVLPGADMVYLLFLFGMFIPYQAVMIPWSSS